MNVILETQGILRLDCWADRLAELTRIAWTGQDGQCYFPYLPLTTAEFWQNEVVRDWGAGIMSSWALLEDGRIVAHAALVNKGDYWELGRWVALPDAPHGAVTTLCREIMQHVHEAGINIQVECTQAHTSSQYICEQIGLRFAGIGILSEVDGIIWDIIYFDNQKLPSFTPRVGVLGNPHGCDIRCLPEHRARLAQIADIISTERGGELPPKMFHTLVHLVEPIRRIIALNR